MFSCQGFLVVTTAPDNLEAACFLQSSVLGMLFLLDDSCAVLVQGIRVGVMLQTIDLSTADPNMMGLFQTALTDLSNAGG